MRGNQKIDASNETILLAYISGISLICVFDLFDREVSFSVRVVDESDRPIMNAEVVAGFPVGSGEPFKSVVESKVTGAEGVCSFRGETSGEIIWAVTKEGYYRVTLADLVPAYLSSAPRCGEHVYTLNDASHGLACSCGKRLDDP